MNWTLCTEVKPGWCDRQHMMEEQTKLLNRIEKLEEALKLAETVIQNNWGPVGTEDPPLIAETRAAIKQCEHKEHAEQATPLENK